ncbi:MAG: FecR domain-containing protein [Alphaproteobacteria bacterium]|nr:FecR domain-containing protein [Alphaproteobacteria bacterium]
MLRVLLALLLFWFCPVSAAAEDPGPGPVETAGIREGLVLAVQTRDRAGGWRPWDSAQDEALQEAWILQADARAPLAVGTRIALSDVVVTRQARVRMELPDKGEITIYEDSYVRLEEWGLRHELGGLLVKVQGAFKVQYASTEALVEGTRFRVEAITPEEGMVAVEEGKVRVRNELGEVLLLKGQAATFGPSQAPAFAKSGRLPVPRRWRPASVGLQVGGGLGDHIGLDKGAGEIRADILTRVRLGNFGLTNTVGVVNSTTTSHFPVTAGGEYWFGPVAVGAQGDLLLGTKELCGTGTTSQLVASGAGHLTGAVRVPLGPALVLDGRVLAGWSTGPQAFGTVGLSWRP